MLKQLTKRRKTRFISNILKRRKYKQLRTGLSDHDVLVKNDTCGHVTSVPGRSIEVLECDPDYEAQFVFQAYIPAASDGAMVCRNDGAIDDVIDNNNGDCIDGKCVQFSTVKQVSDFSNGIDITVIEEHSRSPKKRKSIRKRAKKGLVRAASYTWTGLKAVFTGMSLVASSGSLAFNVPSSFKKST